MSGENWQKIKEVFDSALRQKPGERAEFVRRACGGDKFLLSEVESLLSSFESAKSFLETPAIAKAVGVNETETKTLETGKRFGHYEIIRQIGAGGMGEVYMAQDKKLDRRVAVKILNEKFSRDETNLRRFTREAKAASALNHPNILVIHEIGESENTHYIVSEFVEGKTLREILGESPIKLAEVLEVALQIGNALAAAHQARLVHRDIKPENIMIRPDGFVKILDFGLAKLVAEKNKSFLDLEESTVKENQTAKGVILGTVNYMSPEQAKGERVDERTDIFSFGAVVYEMIAGRAPFAGESVSETFASLINQEPPPLARFAPNAPDELQRIVSKTLRKNADERYQTIKGLLSDLKDLRETLAFDERLEKSHSPDGKGAVGFLQVTTANLKRQTDETGTRISGEFKRHQSFAALAAVFLLVAAVGFGYWFFANRQSKQIESIAVMPFVNQSGNADIEYLSDGMTETLISRLSQIPNLNVKAHSTVFRYKDKETPTPVIGKELNVQAILNGKVRQRGGDLSLYVELIDPATEKAIWSQTYNRAMTNLVSLQNEITHDVAGKLQTKLSGAEERILAKKYTENPQAYQLYLRGRFHWNKRKTEDFYKAIEYFNQAIAADPNYALAYTGISESYAYLAAYRTLPPRETYPQAKEAALKALALDDQSAEAHAALGFVLCDYDHDFAAAEENYKRAIELNPNYATAHLYYGELHTWLGRFAEAEAAHRRALELEPFSLGVNWLYAFNLYHARRYDESIAQAKKLLEMYPDFAWGHTILAFNYRMKGDYAECVEEHAKSQETFERPENAELMRESFAQGGWKGFLQAMTGERSPHNETSSIKAAYYAELGEKEKAFAQLEKIYDYRAWGLVSLKVEPSLDPLRDDPRFQDLLRRVGFQP